MANHELRQLVEQAATIIKQTGNFIKIEAGRFKKSDVELKGFNDLVSYVDKQSEIQLVENLSALIPDAGFLLEENTSSKNTDSEYYWIIDPLDGTTNFVHGVPCYSISVALARNKEILIGIVLEINQDEMFTSYKNGGAYLNNSQIHMSGATSPNNTLVATGFPYNEFSKMENYMEIFEFCMKNTHGVRRFGSAAVDLAYTACGRFDVFYEYGLNAWDVAAGTLLVKEAGGIVTDFSGGANFVFGREILAAGLPVHDQFLDVTKKSFGYS